MIKTYPIRLLFLLLLFQCQLLLGAEESSSNICPYSGSVNVITGDYCEAQTDLVMEGPHPFALKRCFFGCESGYACDGLAWHFNHPNIISPYLGVIPEFEAVAQQFTYIEDLRRRLQEVKLGDHTLCTMTYSDDASDGGGFCKVETADGRAVEYHYSDQTVSRDTPGLNIDRFVDVCGNETRYSYRQHPLERKMLISRCEYPGGSWVETEYYEGKHNNVGGTLVTIEDPIRDPRIGRIKQQMAPVGPGNTPVITQKFFYHDGYTDVVRANGQRTRYRYDKSQYLTAVETYMPAEGGERLYKVEKLFWTGSETDLPRKLCSRAVEDGHGRVVSCQTYRYDAKGNMIEEALYGNITGTSLTPIVLGTDGIPKDKGAECCKTHYEYAFNKDEGHSTLTKKVEQNGKVTRYKYDPATGKVAALLVCEGERIRLREFYRYDSEAVLTEIVSDDGITEECDDLTCVTERRLVKMHLRQEQPSCGMAETIEEFCYDAVSGVMTPIKTSHNTFSLANKLVRQDIYGSDGSYAYSCNFDYDPCGRCLYKEEDHGKRLSYKYDDAGNAVFERVVVPDGTVTEKNHEYDLVNRLIKSIEVDANGVESVNAFRYDEMNNKVASIDSYGNETRYHYDSFGRLTKIVYPSVLGINDESVTPVVENQYDINNNVVATVDPNGYMTRTQYNAKGNPIVISHPDGTEERFEYALDGSLKKKVDRNGMETCYERDFLDRILTKEVYSATGELLAVSTAEYNAYHKISSTDANGVTTEYHYDGAGRLMSTVTSTDEGIQRKEYEYDALGKLHRQKEWYGEGAEDYRCVVAERDAAGSVVETHIENAWGEILRKKYLEEDSEEAFDTSITYRSSYEGFNSRGQKSREEKAVDRNGVTLTKAFDVLGRLEEVVKEDPQGGMLQKVSMRYDPAGNKIKETHVVFGGSNGDSVYVTTWKYGPNNRIEAVVEGEGSRNQRTTLYQYNAFGQVESVIKPDRVVLTQEYNGQGLVSRLSSSDGSVDYTYRYDAAGNIVEAFDAVTGRGVDRAYNASNRLISETQCNGAVVSFSYDMGGRRKRLSFHDGSSVGYQYDAVNLKAVERYSQGRRLAYRHTYDNYDLEGRLMQAELIASLGTIAMHYGEHGQCSAIETPFWSESTQWSEERSSTHLPSEVVSCDPLGESRVSYGYDSSQRVIAESGDVDSKYNYDSVGNRQGKGDQSYRVNDVNEVLSDGIAEYSYDANGNMTKIESECSEVELKYDALNRLVEVNKDQTVHVRYGYDPFNRRVEREVVDGNSHGSAKKEHFLYDGDNEIGTLDDKGRILSLRILGAGCGADIGAAVAIEKAGKVYAPIHDRMGSLRCLVDAKSGEVVEFYRFNVFGEEELFDGDGQSMTSDEAISPWRFRSKRCDSATGFLFFGKREYIPSLGRWTTLDPLGHHDGTNRFLFVHNNPMVNHDHYGLFSFSSAWSGMVDAFSACWGWLAEVGDKLFGCLRAETQYFQKIRPGITEAFEKYFGKGFLTFNGYYRHPMESGVYGQGEINGNVRITLINGIANVRSYYKDSLELINRTHGGVNIHYIFRPTEGWCNDLVKALLIKFGYVSPYARELASTWKKLIEEMGGIDGGGTIIHYCHSLGGSDTATAASLLTPEERSMIQVVSLGSATMIKDSLGFQSVTNYVSKRDGVCLFDPIGYFSGMFNKESNVCFIGSLFGIPLIDHSLAMATYTETINNLGCQFLQMYAYAKGFIY